MLPIEYWVSIKEQWEIYCLIVSAFTVLHYIIFKNYIFGVFDFYFLPVVGNIFSCSIVAFMFFNNDIKEIYFYSFFLGQALLYLGFLLSAKNKIIFNTENISNSLDKILCIESIYFSSVFVYIFTTLFSYYMAGIPLLRVSRLAAFEGSGGYGVIERASSVSLILLLTSVSIVFYFHIKNKNYSIKNTKKAFYLLTLGLVAISLILSGSKATFLVFFEILFLVQVKFYGNNFKKYFNYRFILLAGIIMILLSFMVIYNQSSDISDLDFYEILYKLFDQILFRFSSYGDVYIFSYINENIIYINGDNLLVALFGGFFSTFRLFPVEMMYESVGLQLAKIVSPAMDYVAGPNPRHNIIGYHFLGLYLSLIYSFILGILLGLVRNLLYKPSAFEKKIRWNLFCMVSLISLVSLDTDFEYALSGVASAIIICPIIYLIARVLKYSKISR